MQPGLLGTSHPQAQVREAAGPESKWRRCTRECRQVDCIPGVNPLTDAAWESIRPGLCSANSTLCSQSVFSLSAKLFSDISTGSQNTEPTPWNFKFRVHILAVLISRWLIRGNYKNFLSHKFFTDGMKTIITTRFPRIK